MSTAAFLLGIGMCVQTCWLDRPPPRVLAAEVTAYTIAADECEPWADGRTATGTLADWRRGIVAVDPHTIPLRSWVWIDGLGWFRAEDTGGAIRGARIDVLMRSKREARRWGRRRVAVVVGGVAG